MANRTGAQHPLPKISRSLVTVSGAPRVQYATTSPETGASAQGLQSLGDVLGHLASRSQDRLDIQAQSEALREGAAAGAKPELPSIQDDTTIRGRAFNSAARDAVEIRVEVDGRKALAEYENAHSADPAGFKAKASSYIDGQLPQLQSYDPSLAQRYEADYRLRADSAMERIKEKQMSILRDQQLESTLRYRLNLQDEMAQDAADLFSAGPQEAQKILTRMTANTAKLAGTSTQLGPDGRPLFSARERVMASREAETMLSQSVGQAWMQSQPDMLSAWESWQKGTAEIELAGDDGVTQKLNMKALLGPAGYRAAGESFMDSLRSELSLRSQIDAAQDRSFKDVSDQEFSDLSVRAQEGGLTLSQVEESRHKLEPDRYLALRSLAKKGGASVSDGRVLSELAIQDADGQDIRQQLRNAIDAGMVSNEDYVQLYQRNAGRIDKGTKDPVQTGRDYLTQSLGAMAKDLDVVQSASIGQATAEFEIEIQDFIQKNGRQPNHKEARDIGDGVRQRFSATSVETSIIAIELPKSMTHAEKISKTTTSEKVQEIVGKVNREYLAKHGGNVEQRNSDPEYLHEIKLLKNIYDLKKLKESGDDVRPSVTK